VIKPFVMKQRSLKTLKCNVDTISFVAETFTLRAQTLCEVIRNGQSACSLP
jgi:hypothetical protein